MKQFKTFLPLVFALIMCFAAVNVNAAYTVEEFGITNIDIPENYMACSRSYCDPDLEPIITQSGFAGLNDWVLKVMEPGKYYIYSCHKTDLTKCMYLVCEKLESPKTPDNLVTHKLALDYNLYESTAEKAEFLDNMKRAAATDNAQWVSTDGVTPYIEYFSSVGEDKIHRYDTIYGGNKISLQFSSKKDFTPEEIASHLAILGSMKHSEIVDYTEINKEIDSAHKKKLEEETHSGKNTRILWIIISVSVGLIILFSIYMSIRSQKKKRNKVIVLREPQAFKDDINTDDE